jgi:hypothetical protein
MLLIFKFVKFAYQNHDKSPIKEALLKNVVYLPVNPTLIRFWCQHTRQGAERLICHCMRQESLCLFLYRLAIFIHTVDFYTVWSNLAIFKKLYLASK